MIRAVIFDMDGTLFDTEIMYRDGWLAAGLTLEQYYQLIGRGHTLNDQTLVSWGMCPEEIRHVRDEHVRAALKERGLPLKPGAREVLEWLAERRIPAAIATSSPLTLAEQYMELSGLGRYFAAVLSGYSLERGKPAPDLFLLAAERLHSEPASCMVVEDSYNGVRAGRNAGMVTVMVPDLVAPDEEISALADAVLDSLSELPSYIQSWNRC